MTRKAVLIIGLSSAPHLLDEIKTSDYVYAGPRFNTGTHFIQTSSSPKLSHILKLCIQKNFCVNRIILYCDVYSLSQFQPQIDIDFPSIVAVIGDTHHGSSPLLPLIKWLTKSRIHKVALKQTAHHLPIFKSYGFEVCILPYYAHNNLSIAPSSKYIERACFVGSLSSRHYKRKKFIEYLQARNLPLDIFSAPRNITFSFYNKYSVSLNIPLNYDYNYRINEVMSAGGCLVTSKVPTSISNHLYATDFFNACFYDSYENAYRIVSTLLENQSLRNYIANNAFVTFNKLLSSCYNYNLLTNFALHPSHNSVVENHQLDLSLLAFEDIQSNMVTDELKFTPIICSHIPSSWSKIFL